MKSFFLKSKGKILFTHQGLSGPGILNISNAIGDGLKHGQVTLKLNLVPELKEEELSQSLTKLLIENPNKLVKNLLNNFVPAALAIHILDTCKLATSTKANQVTRNKKTSINQYDTRN